MALGGRLQLTWAHQLRHRQSPSLDHERLHWYRDATRTYRFTAAHIVPWSETRDDRPANGMALCRMCHWTFDEGLLGVSQEYQVITSQQLIVSNNLPGYLTNLEGRGIVGPAKKAFWPDTESLRWHQENVLLSR